MSLDVDNNGRPSSQKFDILKLILTGNSAVGKTALLQRFTDDIFIAKHCPTIGVDFKCKNIEVDEKSVKLQMWDTAGEERFATITSSYYRGASGIIIVFDVTDQDSFEAVEKWVDEISRYAVEGIPKMLVGNKCDQPDRAVQSATAMELAESLDMRYLETSAKTNEGVEAVFRTMTKYVLDWRGDDIEEQRMHYMTASRTRRSACCTLI